jgi:hypothetical protein
MAGVHKSMKWVLVLIFITNGESNSDYIGEFDSMYDCFYAREDLARQTGSDRTGYFLPGMQGICIATQQEELK